MGSDFSIRKSFDFIEKFTLPAACKHYMGMRIAKRRHNHAAVRVDNFRTLRLRATRHAAEIFDALIVDENPGIIEGSYL